MSTAPDTRPRTPAWFVLWECHCYAVKADRADLPDTCPGHDRGPVEAPELLPNVLVEFVDTHECEQSCTDVAS